MDGFEKCNLRYHPLPKQFHLKVALNYVTTVLLQGQDIPSFHVASEDGSDGLIVLHSFLTRGAT